MILPFHESFTGEYRSMKHKIAQMISINEKTQRLCAYSWDISHMEQMSLP